MSQVCNRNINQTAANNMYVTFLGSVNDNFNNKKQKSRKPKMKITEHSFGDFFITTDKTKLDIVAIHDFLSKHSGWSDNIPLDQ